MCSENMVSFSVIENKEFYVKSIKGTLTDWIEVRALSRPLHDIDLIFLKPLHDLLCSMARCAILKCSRTKLVLKEKIGKSENSPKYLLKNPSRSQTRFFNGGKEVLLKESNVAFSIEVAFNPNQTAWSLPRDHTPYLFRRTEK